MVLPLWIQAQVESFKNDNARSASQMALQAIRIMQETAEHSDSTLTSEALIETIEETGRLLIAGQPDIPSVFNMVGRALTTLTSNPVNPDQASLRRTFIRETNQLLEDQQQAVFHIAGFVAGMLEPNRTVLTFSYSSTVLTALTRSYLKNRPRIIIPRSGYSNGGLIAARYLADKNIPVTLVDDILLASTMPVVDLVLLGADRITADGRLVNAAGTKLICQMAELNNVPVCVLCETLKFDHRSSDQKHQAFPETIPAELSGLPEQITVFNPLFEMIDLFAGTRLITENGITPVETMFNQQIRK